MYENFKRIIKEKSVEELRIIRRHYAELFDKAEVDSEAESRYFIKINLITEEIEDRK